MVFAGHQTMLAPETRTTWDTTWISHWMTAISLIDVTTNILNRQHPDNDPTEPTDMPVRQS